MLITTLLQIGKQNPNKTALVYWENDQRHTLTYKKLLEQSQQFAGYLKTLNLADGAAVGLCFPPGPDYPIWLLALWQAGLAYLPFAWRDKDSREDNLKRIADNLKIAGAKYLITSNEYQSYFIDQLEDFKLIVQQNIGQQKPLVDVVLPAPQQTAYFICSSGTTGNPKMIAIPHEGMADRIKSHIERMQITANDNVLTMLDFEFDASLVEMLMALTVGSTLIIASPEVRKFKQPLEKFFQINAKKYPISTAIWLPSILAYIKNTNLNADHFPGLKRFITTGEACRAELLERWWQTGIKIFNGYGPTETTFGASLTEVAQNQPISIHAAMQGIRMLLMSDNDHTTYVLDDIDSGEIFLTGTGIGQYIGNETMQQKYFLTAQDVFTKAGLAHFELTPEDKLYRTFDIAHQQGNYLIYDYRKDGIIKRAGKQIALPVLEEEMSHALKAVCEKVIVSIIDRHQGSFAIFLKPIQQVEPLQLTTAITTLKQTLSVYRRPNQWWLLKSDAKLVTEKGKTQTKFEILKHEAQELPLAQQDIETPLNETEKKIERIWRNIFNLQGITLTHGFDFAKDLGATSLQIATMLHQVWQQLIVDSSTERNLPALFFQYLQDHLTLACLAKLVTAYKELKLEAHKNSTSSQFRPNVFLLGKVPAEIGQTLSATDQFNIRTITNIPEDNELASYVIAQKIASLQLNNAQLLHTEEQSPLALQIAKHSQQITPIKMSDESEDFIEEAIKTSAHRQTESQLKLHLKQLAQQIQRNHPAISTLYSHQANILKSINAFLENTESKIFLILGAVGCGKSQLCRSLLELAGSRLTIYLSLRNYRHPGDIEKMLNAQGLSDAELFLLKKQKSVCLILEDYDLIQRDDFPDLWQQEEFKDWHDLKIIITCRDWYLKDPRCLLHWKNDTKNILNIESLNTPDLNELRQHTIDSIFSFAKNKIGLITLTSLRLCEDLLSEFKLAIDWNPEDAKLAFVRAWLENELKRSKHAAISINRFISLLEQIAIQHPISTLLQPSPWQVNASYDKSSQIVNRHSAGFALLAGLLKLRSCTDDKTFIFEAHESWKNFLKQKILSTKLAQGLSHADTTELINTTQTSNDSALITLQANGNHTPIFTFAPLSGDLPKAYRDIAAQLGETQPFYCFVLSQNGTDRTDDLAQRSKYYVDQITLKYPNPHDPHQEIILIGYSFGCVQMAAAAVELEKRKYRIALMLNLDCPAPNDIAVLQDNQTSLKTVLIKLIDLYSKHLSEQTKKKLIQQLENPNTPVTRYFAIACEALNPEEKERFLPILKNSEINWNIYVQTKIWFDQHFARPQKLKAPMVSFVAEKRNPGLNDHAQYDWSDYCKQHTLINIPGDHFSLFNDALFLKIIAQIQTVQIPSFVAPFEQRALYHLNTAFKVDDNKPDFHLDLITQSSDSFNESSFREQQTLFLSNEDVKTLVIIGAPGAGKSTAIKHFAKTVANSDSGQAIRWLPIFIALQQREQLDVTAILANINIRTSEIPNGWGLIFFCDGFDEMKTPQHLSHLLQPLNCPAKIVITCRDYYYEQNLSKNYFGLHRRLELKPLNSQQQEQYINATLANPDDRKFLSEEPSLTALINNPLLLSLSVRFIKEIKASTLFDQFNRTFLYQLFIQSLWNAAKQYRQQEAGIRPTLKCDSIFQNYVENLAIALWQHQTDFAHYLADDPDTQLARSQSLVKWKAGQPEFIYPTFIEYLVAQRLVNELIAYGNNPRSSNTFSIVLEKQICHQQNSLLIFFQEHCQNLSPADYQQVCDGLMNLVLASRHNPTDAPLAGNAITLLKTIGFAFAKLDLSYLYLQHADFSGVALHDCDFSYAHLKDCHFIRTNLVNTSFANAKLAQCNFGELPGIIVSGELVFYQYIPAYEQWLIVANRMLDQTLKTCVELWSLTDNQTGDQCVATHWIETVPTVARYNMEQQHLVLLCNTESASTLITLNIQPSKITAESKQKFDGEYHDLLTTEVGLVLLDTTQKHLFLFINSAHALNQSAALNVDDAICWWHYDKSTSNLVLVQPHARQPLQLLNLINFTTKTVLLSETEIKLIQNAKFCAFSSASSHVAFYCENENDASLILLVDWYNQKTKEFFLDRLHAKQLLFNDQNHELILDSDDDNQMVVTKLHIYSGTITEESFAELFEIKRMVTGSNQLETLQRWGDEACFVFPEFSEPCHRLAVMQLQDEKPQNNSLLSIANKFSLTIDADRQLIVKRNHQSYDINYVNTTQRTVIAKLQLNSTRPLWLDQMACIQTTHGISLAAIIYDHNDSKKIVIYEFNPNPKLLAELDNTVIFNDWKLDDQLIEVHYRNLIFKSPTELLFNYSYKVLGETLEDDYASAVQVFHHCGIALWSALSSDAIKPIKYLQRYVDPYWDAGDGESPLPPLFVTHKNFILMSYQRVIHLYNNDLQETASLEQAVEAMALILDGSFLCTALDDQIRIFKIENDRLKLTTQFRYDDYGYDKETIIMREIHLRWDAKQQILAIYMNDHLISDWRIIPHPAGLDVIPLNLHHSKLVIENVDLTNIDADKLTLSLLKEKQTGESSIANNRHLLTVNTPSPLTKQNALPLLPAEIWQQLYQYLNYQDYLSLVQTCTALRAVALDAYNIEKFGALLTTTFIHTHLEQLKQLVQRIQTNALLPVPPAAEIQIKPSATHSAMLEIGFFAQSAKPINIPANTIIKTFSPTVNSS